MTPLTQLLLPYVLLGCIALWVLRKRAARLRLRYRHWCAQLDENERMKRILAAACVAYRTSAPMPQAASPSTTTPTSAQHGMTPSSATEHAAANGQSSTVVVPAAVDYAPFDVPAYVRKGIQFVHVPPAAPVSRPTDGESIRAEATVRAEGILQSRSDQFDDEEPVAIHER